LRASKAIHLLDSGVNIIAIRDFLGHVSVSTTQVYLRVNNQAKRNAIAQAYPSLVEPVPEWQGDGDLMALLKSLCT
jgi:site-specific recombinase XerD